MKSKQEFTHNGSYICLEGSEYTLGIALCIEVKGNVLKVFGKEKYSEDMTVLKQNSVSETYPLHTHTFYEYFLVSKGRALHIANGTVQVVERGSLVLVRPLDQHYYGYYKSRKFEFYNVGVLKKKFKVVNQFYNGAPEHINSLPAPIHIILNEAHTRQMEEYLMKLKKQSDGQERDQLFLMLLSMVVYFILTERGHKIPHIPDWMVNVLDKMEKPENYIQGLDKLLEISHYSQEYINREFKRYLHTTPTRYINEKRLAYAKNLLTNTSLTTLEVCERCGFHSLSYFYNRYKEYYGCTPRNTK